MTMSDLWQCGFSPREHRAPKAADCRARDFSRTLLGTPACRRDGHRRHVDVWQKM
jgi:hypothetical protein